MKVMLVNPPYEESTYVTPPLGIAYIASVLIRSGHKLKIIDAPAMSYDYPAVKREIEGFSPDLVGITSMTPTIKGAVKTAEIAKSIAPVPVVIGGPHASIMPDETAKLKDVDIVVRGEGEEVMRTLLGAMESEEDIKTVRGISFKKNGRVVHTPNMPLIEDLDVLPFPARDLLAGGNYRQHVGHPTSFATMITSRGCPHNCIYCTKAIFGRQYRFRSAANVIEEIQQVISEYKVKEIVFYDDAFTANRRRTIELCDEIVKNNIDVTWKCESRVDTVDREVLQKMKKAGCDIIAYGVESGSDELLNTIGKRTTTEKIREAFKTTKEVGIQTLAYIMIGIPGETKETIQKTLDFTIELDPDYVQFSIATPYPQTELYNIAKEKGYLKEDSWSKYAYTGDSATPVMRTEALTQEELSLELKRMIRKFYLRPHYVLKQLRMSTSLDMWRRNISGLKSVLGWVR